MYRTIVVLAALVALAYGQTTIVQQCTENPGPLPINAHIAGCSSPPCSLTQLQNAVINIVFRAPRNMRTMRTRAIAYLSVFGFPVPVPYDLQENAQTCNFLGNSYCPVLEGEVLDYTLYMYIESTFPVGIAPTVEFRIEDENDVNIMCIRVPIVIASPNTRAGNTTEVLEDKH